MNHAHRPSRWRERVQIVAEAVVFVVLCLAVLFILTLDGVK